MRCHPIVLACALLLAAPVASAQESVKAGANLRQPAEVVYPTGRLAIEYSLEQPAERVEIDVFDATGAVVAGWTGGQAGQAAAGPADRFALAEALTRPGSHTVTWDLHANGYFAPAVAGAPARFQPGPLVPPGIYVLQVAASGQTARQAFKVVADPPLTPETQAIADARFGLAMQVRGRASAASAAIRRARALRARVAAKLKTAEDPEFVDAGNGLLRRLAAIEGADSETTSAPAGLLSQHAALAALLVEIEAVQSPTAVQHARFQDLSAGVQSNVAGLNGLVAGSYARFERGDVRSGTRGGPKNAGGLLVLPQVAAPTIDTAVPLRTPADKVYQLGEPGLVLPRSIVAPSPDYTLLAYQKGIQGTVTLSGVIEVNGTVHDVKVVKSLDPGLDEKAVRALEKWRYAPGRKDGKPVPVGVTVEMKFELRTARTPIA
jgi:TonB family protein